jgi:hypothetical protein
MSARRSGLIDRDGPTGARAARPAPAGRTRDQPAAGVSPGTAAAATVRVQQLQRAAGNHAVARMIASDRVQARVRPTGRRGVLQRMTVTELAAKDIEQWYVIQGNVVAKLNGIDDGTWEFRVRDDVYGKGQFVYLTAGRVVPLPNFGVVIARMYGGDEENWFGEMAAQAAQNRRQWGRVGQMSYDELLSIGERSLAKTEVTEYDKTFVTTGEGIWTDGMGPCITVAMTGLCGTVRVNALHHSFVTHIRRDMYAKIGERIVADFKAKVEHATGRSISEIKDQRFYVVGGDTDTAVKMEKLLTELLYERFNVMGVADTTSERPGASSKAVLITAEGEVRWSHKTK